MGDNDLIKKIFTNSELFEQYKSTVILHLNHLLNEDVLFPIIDSTASYIEEGYNLDSFLGNGRFNLKDKIGELKLLIVNRKKYLLDNLDNIHQSFL